MKPNPDSKFKPRKRKKEKKPVKKILKKAPLQKQTHKKSIQATKNRNQRMTLLLKSLLFQGA